MSAPARVRPALAAHASTIAEFNSAMALETEGKRLAPDVIGPGVEAVLADPSLGRYFVAEHDGTVVGCLLITFEWSDWRNGLFWWIQSVYVTPHARRRGVFQGLYRHVREAAIASGNACGLRLYVERENTAAQSTYAALGMHCTPYRLYEEEFER